MAPPMVATTTATTATATPPLAPAPRRRPTATARPSPPPPPPALTPPRAAARTSHRTESRNCWGNEREKLLDLTFLTAKTSS